MILSSAEVVEDELDRPTYRLSPREAEVLMALARGLTHGEAGALLGISPHTVRNHAVSLRASLGALSMAHAVHIAHERKLI